MAPTHGNVDINGDIGQGQAVAPWTSSQLPAREKKREGEEPVGFVRKCRCTTAQDGKIGPRMAPFKKREKSLFLGINCFLNFTD